MSGSDTKTDLTRWNRAGLRRFRYVDATAVEHFETLRAELARRFPAYRHALERELEGVDEAARREDPQRREARLLEQYQAPTGDPVLEIMRTLARATHVLTEHIDAYANEGFIETATQWDPVRRLVQLLGYHPAPPASAETWLVVLAKPAARGPLERGFQVKHAPADGRAPLVFETLQDLPLDDRLNQLHPAGHDRSVALFDPFATGDTPWRFEPAMKLSVGQPAVLLQELQPRRPGFTEPEPVPRRAMAVALGAVDAADLSLAIGPGGPQPDWRRGHTRLLAAPVKVWRPRLNGPRRVGFDREHGLAPGDIVVWKDGTAWRFDRVAEADARAVALAQAGLPALGATVFKAGLVAALPDAAGNQLRLPLDLDAAVQVGTGGVLVPLDLDRQFQTETTAQGQIALWLKPRAGQSIVPPIGVLAVLRTPQVGQVAALGSPAWQFDFDGSPTGLASGQWVVADEGLDTAGLPMRRAVRIERVEARDGAFTLTLGDGLAAATTVAPEALAELQQRLVEVEMALDQAVWQALTLGDLARRAIDAYATGAIQGVGPVRAPGEGGYAQPMRQQQVATVADLAAMAPERSVPGLSPVRLREFQAKARIVRDFRVDTARFAPLLGLTLAQVMALAPGAAGGGAGGSGVLLRLERLHGPLRHTIAPLRHDVNDTPLVAQALPLALDALPPLLMRGRRLLLERPGDDGAPVVRRAVVEAVDGNRLVFASPPPDLRGFTRGNTVIRANVVPAGHGETRAAKVLGSGNAAVLHQAFVLPVAGVSFVADPTQPAGVRADIAVEIDGRTWQQVGTLADSGPADAHYTVRLDEDGHLRIAFGDGRRGRRLPTGSNNLRVVHRSGSGLAGNLPAGSLVQPARPHRLVGSVRQPLASVGGNDLETVASLRSNAPASLLTLERAVSLTDFANLAASQASIWQARAFALPTPAGRREGVEVVLVPANGAALDPVSHAVDAIVLDPLLVQQAAWLRAHALPGTAVTARVYEPVLVDLEVIVAIKPAEYDVEYTLAAVRAALRALLALERRTLGQPLHRSELFEAVEAVPGVEYSRCTMTPTAGTAATPKPARVLPADRSRPIETLVPTPRQVIHLDPLHSVLRVTAMEFEL